MKNVKQRQLSLASEVIRQLPLTERKHVPGFLCTYSSSCVHPN
jgi:hypothetical protein